MNTIIILSKDVFVEIEYLECRQCHENLEPENREGGFCSPHCENEYHLIREEENESPDQLVS